MVFSDEAVDIGSVLSGAVVSDVTEAVEFDNKDVLLPKPTEAPEDEGEEDEADDSDEHNEEPDEDDSVEDDNEVDDIEADVTLFGDFGELFR